MSEYRYSTMSSEAGFKAYMSSLYAKMGIAMAITAAIAACGYYSLISGNAFGQFLYGILSGYGYLFVVIAQLVICVVMSSKLTTMNSGAVTGLFYGYAALTGVTFTILPLAYGVNTVFTAFLFTAVMFFCCAIIGKTTNVDLSKFSGLLIGGLTAMVIASVLSMFIPALRESLFISYFGIILFLFLTAWDIQRIKQFYYGTAGGQGVLGENLSTYGAFQLYLDFINLFLQVLRIFGSRSNRD